MFSPTVAEVLKPRARSDADTERLEADFEFRAISKRHNMWYSAKFNFLMLYIFIFIITLLLLLQLLIFIIQRSLLRPTTYHTTSAQGVFLPKFLLSDRRDV